MRERRTMLLGALAVLVVSAALPASAAPAMPSGIAEYQIPSPGAPEGIAAGPDGALWFSERYTDQIGRVTRRGRFTIYSLSSTTNMSADITAGPDGALWFTFPNNVPPNTTGQIGRITPAGNTSFYPIPWTSDPEAITTGPDGNLWFTDHLAAAIGKVTPGGAVTKFAISGPTGSYPYKIAAGPDGALWFTDLNARRVGRISTGGRTRFYSIPEGDGYPDAISKGPDGALWFTLDDTGRIGRLTTAGVLSEYQLDHPPGDFVFLAGITTGRDGALWFTYHDYTIGASKIGRITTTGAVSLFPTPTANSAPQGITARAGALWFTEAAARQIGRIRTG
jgi:streptogramin lyase